MIKCKKTKNKTNNRKKKIRNKRKCVCISEQAKAKATADKTNHRNSQKQHALKPENEPKEQEQKNTIIHRIRQNKCKPPGPSLALSDTQHHFLSSLKSSVALRLTKAAPMSRLSRSLFFFSSLFLLQPARLVECPLPATALLLA